MNVPTVLIVEDEALIAMELEAIAAEAGYETVVAVNHEQAMATIIAHPIEIALLDHIPDWVDVARRLRDRGVRFAFCSAASEDRPAEFVEAPFIAKPFHQEEIRAVLTDV